ncbi:hypothetical protein RF11_12102 [Thelohanellus kitauei]|uniref:ISXO2-like transposase domain-containing protein n=1 Tax=Thelohanellus kitauei TaxID=669202 RepID=A0A0C2N2K5_THEKT|nr:hypothetical protein RF11_12102 [Thelohanellus kitauei]
MYLLQTGNILGLIQCVSRDTRVQVVRVFDESDFFLGGTGVTIEINEANFGRRKYHRGRGVKGENSRSTQPYFIDSGSQSNSRNVFDHTKMDKTWDTSCSYLGTTVISDGWASYLGLDQMVYLHLILNHSQTFIDQTSGALTNIIEGNWNHARSHIPLTRIRKWLYKSHLLEYSYLQRFNEGTFNQSFGRFLAHIKDIYNPFIENKFIEGLQLTNDALRSLPELQVITN